MQVFKTASIDEWKCSGLLLDRAAATAVCASEMEAHG